MCLIFRVQSLGRNGRFMPFAVEKATVTAEYTRTPQGPDSSGPSVGTGSEPQGSTGRGDESAGAHLLAVGGALSALRQ